MGMVVRHGFMVVGMAVRLAGINTYGVINTVRMFNTFGVVMQMVRIAVVGVHVRVAVRGMGVHVRVVFRQVQPHARNHQQTGGQQLPRHGLGKQRNGQRRADKRRC